MGKCFDEPKEASNNNRMRIFSHEKNCNYRIYNDFRKQYSNGLWLDYADAVANWETANINAQEQADVMHEVREGDFREAQEVIQRDEAIKYEIRRQEAMYDNARAMSQYNNGYYGYQGW